MIKPTGTRILVEPIEQKETVTKSGIILNANWNAAPESVSGTVLAVGPGVTVTQVGDIVLVPQYSPTKAVENIGDKTFIVPEEDVLAVITND